MDGRGGKKRGKNENHIHIKKETTPCNVEREKKKPFPSFRKGKEQINGNRKCQVSHTGQRMWNGGITCRSWIASKNCISGRGGRNS